MKNIKMIKKIVLLLLVIAQTTKADDGILRNTVVMLSALHYEAEKKEFPFNWQGGFSDYPKGSEDFYQLKYEYIMHKNKYYPYISGINYSDDLFMYFKTKIKGFKKNTFYNVVFNIEFVTSIPDGLIGAGGSPGEGVAIKVGATTIEPMQDKYYMNIDIGHQQNSGKDMRVIGDFSNDTNSYDPVLKQLDNKKRPHRVLSNEFGEIWLIVGSDSGFEGHTHIIYTKLDYSISEAK